MWQKIKNAMARFLTGRHGSDQLSLATLIVGFILTILSSITGLGILSLIGFVLYVLTLFRILSHNNEKRTAENEKYLRITRNLKSEIKQFFARLKNCRKYKYFRCPECNARLRLPRKVGEVNVTCGKCKHQFKMKA